MNPSDIYAVLQWWLTIFIIGTGFLPITLLLFSSFFDKGYIFSKVLGVAIASYAVFIFGILHLVPFNQITAFFVFLFVAIVFTYFLPMKWHVIYLLKHNWKIFIFEEIFFLVAIFTWVYIHSYNPDIHGLEKYMDYGFINSILRADYFPPKDMWFPPELINYYYYGHFITAFLTKLSGVPSALTFNIMLSTIFAWCLTETFSIGANLFTFAHKKLPQAKIKFKLIVAGLLTALLTTLGGNLHIIYAFFAPYKTDNPKPFWELDFLPLTFPNSYWYPNATRYIYNTIHEFPIYSWVVADVHGHVLDIPFVLLIIALLLALFIKADPSAEEEITDEKWHKSWIMHAKLRRFTANFSLHPLSIILLGFLLAIMYMTNAWDGAIYLLLVALVIFYLVRERISEESNASLVSERPKLDIIAAKGQRRPKFKIPKSFWLFYIRLFVPIILVVTTFIIFSFPYNHYFKPFVSGIGVLCAPSFLTKIGQLGPFIFEAEHCQRSFWWEFLMLYGFFYFFVFTFIIYLVWKKKILRIDVFVLLLIILSSLLIFLPEFIYVKDIYPAHFRANTMFKLVFQAFIMLSLVSVYVIARISQSRVRFIFFPISLVLIMLVMTYPYMAIGSYYGDLKAYKGLHGTTYLNTLYPSDYAGILWLNAYVKGQPVILEAQGDSYTDYARVSANTGLPTVLGWTVHEWLWRGEYSIPAPRITDITNIYETNDLDVAKKLLKKYKVKYVFIGTMEYEKYPNLDEKKFEKLGKVVFQQDKTKIYEILR